jgi:hypothetical protein
MARFDEDMTDGEAWRLHKQGHPYDFSIEPPPTRLADRAMAREAAEKQIEDADHGEEEQATR